MDPRLTPAPPREHHGRRRTLDGGSRPIHASKESAMRPTTPPRRLSRRRFLRSAGGAAAAAFTIVPSHVLGLGDEKPPSEKLNIAGIGVGGQGASDIGQMKGENIVALCDVHWDHAKWAFGAFPQAKKYRDFRKMLDEEKSI